MYIYSPSKNYENGLETNLPKSSNKKQIQENRFNYSEFTPCDNQYLLNIKQKLNILNNSNMDINNDPTDKPQEIFPMNNNSLSYCSSNLVSPIYSTKKHIYPNLDIPQYNNIHNYHIQQNHSQFFEERPDNNLSNQNSLAQSKVCSVYQDLAPGVVGVDQDYASSRKASRRQSCSYSNYNDNNWDTGNHKNYYEGNNCLSNNNSINVYNLVKDNNENSDIIIKRFCKSIKLKEYIDGLKSCNIGNDVIIECIVRTYPFEIEAILKGFYLEISENEYPECSC